MLLQTLDQKFLYQVQLTLLVEHFLLQKYDLLFVQAYMQLRVLSFCLRPLEHRLFQKIYPLIPLLYPSPTENKLNSTYSTFTVISSGLGSNSISSGPSTVMSISCSPSVRPLRSMNAFRSSFFKSFIISSLLVTIFYI